MPVLFALFFGAFGIVSALVGYFVYDIGVVAALSTYFIVGGLAPFTMIAMNVAQDDADFAEQGSTQHSALY